jgi:NAD(P)-dependent dehydrogenase (short-subunit alcohol dehydrogenase family)
MSISHARSLARGLNAAAASDPLTFVVFGANQGNIGGCLVERLLNNIPQSTVHILGRSSEKLDALKGSLPNGSGDRVQVEALDAVTDPVAVEKYMKHLGRVDGVANCIGSVLLKPAHSTSDDEWNQIMSVNATSSFNILRAASKKMMRQEGAPGGSIVFCASAVALHGLQNHEAIAAAKGAIAAMAKSAASTYAPKNIRVNCVAPGLIESPMTQKITSNAAARKASESMHALKRIGKPEQVAAAMEFFLQPENDFVTGQILGVCGGLSSVRAQ